MIAVLQKSQKFFGGPRRRKRCVVTGEEAHLYYAVVGWLLWNWRAMRGLVLRNTKNRRGTNEDLEEAHSVLSFLAMDGRLGKEFSQHLKRRPGTPYRGPGVARL